MIRVPGFGSHSDLRASAVLDVEISMSDPNSVTTASIASVFRAKFIASCPHIFVLPENLTHRSHKSRTNLSGFGEHGRDPRPRPAILTPTKAVFGLDIGGIFGTRIFGTRIFDVRNGGALPFAIVGYER